MTVPFPTFSLRRFAVAALLLFSPAANAATPPAEPSQAEVRQTWKMLDYLAVDYAGAVSGGRPTSASEFAEMQEFAQAARTKLEALPARPVQADLVAQAVQLQAAIAAYRDPPEVARLAHGLADALLAAYPIPIAPPRAP